nr:hypothetical protein [Tanacetum cinerariifolium]
ASTIYYNNLIDQSLGSNRAGTYRSFSTGYLNWTPIKGLTLRTEIGGDFLNLNEDLVRGAGTQDGGATGYAFNSQTQTDNKIVSFLKLRASYGVTGNGEIGDFNSRRLVSALPYADQSGIAPGYVTGGAFVTGLGNPNLSWETTKQVDLGVEFGFLDNRITG